MTLGGGIGENWVSVSESEVIERGIRAAGDFASKLSISCSVKVDGFHLVQLAEDNKPAKALQTWKGGC